MNAGLIISEFTIGDHNTMVIIDSRATASFIPGLSFWTKGKGTMIVDTTNQVQIADNKTISLNRIAKLKTQIKAQPEMSHICQFYIIPGEDNLLGYQAIIGLDLMKKFNISISKSEGIMVAKIEDTQIGKERLLSLSSIAEVITPANQEKLNNLINHYSSVFAESANSFIDIQPMRIDLNSEKMIKARLKHFTLEDTKEMHEHTKKLLDNGVIERSNSPFSCNARLVPKKDGKKRLVINYIPLNNITIEDHFPIPQLQDLFYPLRNAKYFSALDCTEGFHQIPIYKPHKERTAFITPHGQFQYRRCPFGLTNASAFFQRTMNYIFEEELYNMCVVYIDDILVFSETQEKHLENLESIFRKCMKFNIKLKKSKCSFMQRRISFLGYELSNNIVKPIPDRCDYICNIEPTQKEDILSILGTLNFYSKFIPNYAEKTKQLRKLTHKDIEFHWNNAHQNTLKQLLRNLEKISIVFKLR